MRTVLLTLLASTVLAFTGAAAFLYSGIYNVAATDPHWPATHWLMETARMRSIQAHAADIAVPANLSDEARIINGTEHFAAHCASCHSAPGVPRGESAEGMYPKPPALSDATKRYSDAQLFWILKNGIKMSGMPSWADHGNEELWDVVAFLRKLDGMTSEQYGGLVMKTIMRGGQHHHAAAEAETGAGEAHGDHQSMPGMITSEAADDHHH
ncbi:MAG: cytochrome c [Rhodospirillales bacterium]|jgi:mono/diheme cytochrome c family protein|nr:cytochrome c [Rhodospirillales bacterium]MBN8925681.1 cytochrome c [Rhodospirillales bacterium]